MGRVTYTYGPGRPFNALKQRHVSSTSTGPLTCRRSSAPPLPYRQIEGRLQVEQEKGHHTISAARRHLSRDMSSMVPCTSTRSKDWLWSCTRLPRIALTSVNLFALPVMKLRCLGAMVLLEVCRLISLDRTAVSGSRSGQSEKYVLHVHVLYVHRESLHHFNGACIGVHVCTYTCTHNIRHLV
jgi:hypothetical protein